MSHHDSLGERAFLGVLGLSLSVMALSFAAVCVAFAWRACVAVFQ